MTRLDHYGNLLKNMSTAWMASVLFSSTKRRVDCTRALRKMSQLVDRGHDFAPVEFKMPYEAMLIDGRVVAFDEFLKDSFIKTLKPIKVNRPVPAGWEKITLADLSMAPVEE